jgi:hypothetical protein
VTVLRIDAPAKARGLPTVGPLDDPDRMFKLDVADSVGALAYLGPDPGVDLWQDSDVF